MSWDHLALGGPVRRTLLAASICAVLWPDSLVRLLGAAALVVIVSTSLGPRGLVGASIASAMVIGGLPWQPVPAMWFAVQLSRAVRTSHVWRWERLGWLVFGLAPGFVAVVVETMTTRIPDGLVVSGNDTSLGLALAIALAVPLATVNGVAEEVVWRTAAWDGSKRDITYLASALSFAAAHFATGLPSGLVGVILSGCYGLLASEVRLRRGLQEAVLMHIGTDIPIIVYLID